MISKKTKYSLKGNIKKHCCLALLHKNFCKYHLHVVGSARSTVHGYCHAFQLLLLFKPSIKLNDLKEKTIIDFFEFLNIRKRKVGNQFIVRKYKNSSTATVRAKLNAFFKWLIVRGYLEQSPFEKIKYPDVSYTDRRALSINEFEKICFVVSTKIKWQSLLIKKRNIAIIMFLTYSGVRKEELLSLTLKDIDLNGRLITIRAETSKSKRSRIIPINPELIPYIEDYLNYRINFKSPDLWISGTRDQKLTEAGLKHLIKLLSKVSKVNCHVHRFRHTFAANYYMLTHDIYGLKKLMGHTSLKMTLIYLRSIPDEHFAKQINKVSVKEFF